MFEIYKDLLNSCREMLSRNPNDADALASQHIIYNNIFDINTIWFDDYFIEEENILYLQRHLYLFNLVEEISKRKLFPDYTNDRYEKLSKKDLLELVHDFFKNSTNEEFYEIFLRMIRNREITLYKNKKDDFDAFTFYWPHIDKVITVIHCNNYGTGNDFAYVPIIAHEVGHGIDAIINFHIASQQENAIYSEIVSTFFELICNYYFYNTVYVEDAISYAYEFYNDIIQKAKLLSSYKAYENPIENPITFFPYIVAFNIAVELFIIYLNDKDKAFYLLKKLIEIPKFIPHEEYFNRILDLGIKPNNSLDKFENVLKRML